MQPTKEVIKLTPACIEALEKLTLKQCPKCGGLKVVSCPSQLDSAGNMDAGMVTDTMPCPQCNGTGKVKWKWEPKVGEWVFYGKHVELISAEDVENHNCIHLFHVWADVTDCIPILHWETIEKILEKNNYKTYISISDSGNVLCQICFPFKRRGRHNVMVQANAKTRQLAVMKAVIALGKEMEK